MTHYCEDQFFGIVEGELQHIAFFLHQQARLECLYLQHLGFDQLLFFLLYSEKTRLQRRLFCRECILTVTVLVFYVRAEGQRVRAAAWASGGIADRCQFGHSSQA